MGGETGESLEGGRPTLLQKGVQVKNTINGESRDSIEKVKPKQPKGPIWLQKRRGKNKKKGRTFACHFNDKWGAFFLGGVTSGTKDAEQRILRGRSAES